MTERAGRTGLWDPAIVSQAIVGSVRKLDPRIQFRNPVMFIVEVGSLLTTVVWMGRDDSAPMARITGGSAPAEMWRATMTTALKRLAPKPIPFGPAVPAPPPALSPVSAPLNTAPGAAAAPQVRVN